MFSTLKLNQVYQYSNQVSDFKFKVISLIQNQYVIEELKTKRIQTIDVNSQIAKSSFHIIA